MEKFILRSAYFRALEISDHAQTRDVSQSPLTIRFPLCLCADKKIEPLEEFSPMSVGLLIGSLGESSSVSQVISWARG